MIAVVKDGNYFMKVVLDQEKRINKLCAELGAFLPTRSTPESGVVNGDLVEASSEEGSVTSASSSAPPEEACGKIRACIGKANLLTTKKFKQFKGLCEKNLSPIENDAFPTTNDDLSGFWDMVMIQVDQIDFMHGEIVRLKNDGWKQKVENKKPVAKRNPAAKNKPTEEQSAANKAAAAARAKAREDARKKLINSKRMQLKQQKGLQNDRTDDVPS